MLARQGDVLRATLGLQARQQCEEMDLAGASPPCDRPLDWEGLTLPVRLVTHNGAERSLRRLPLFTWSIGLHLNGQGPPM